MKKLLLIVFTLMSFNLVGQFDIFSDNGSVITNVWTANGVFDTISTNTLTLKNVEIIQAAGGNRRQQILKGA